MSTKNDQTHYKPGTSHQIAYTAAAGAASAPLNEHTNVVRMVATTACHVVLVGTATTAGMYLPANVPELFTVNGGETISAIRVGSDGTLHVTEMSQ